MIEDLVTIGNEEKEERDNKKREGWWRLSQRERSSCTIYSFLSRVTLRYIVISTQRSVPNSTRTRARYPNARETDAVPTCGSTSISLGSESTSETDSIEMRESMKESKRIFSSAGRFDQQEAILSFCELKNLGALRVTSTVAVKSVVCCLRNRDHFGGFASAERRIIHESGYVITDYTVNLQRMLFTCIYEDYNRGTVYWTRRFSRSRPSLRAALGAPYCGTSRSVHPVDLMLIAFLYRFSFELERRRYQAHIGRPLFRAQFHRARYLEPLEFAYNRKIVSSHYARYDSDDKRGES